MNDPINLEEIRISVKHDGKLNISVGKSRKEVQWKNKSYNWSTILTKLSKTYYTRETLAEYSKLSKTKQDEIKDVGGFVGGQLKEGRRKSDSVIDRSIISLDADFAPTDLWDSIEMLYDFSICAYSTHKHTQEKPRLRLLIPLKRSVTPDEYEAISRKIAEDLGMDYFDDTTYQASRLMYWPSTSKDGNYFFDYIDGEWLDPDDVLARYTDWRDTSFWPESSRVQKSHKKLADKQGDPLEKPGPIGAFCRAYSIEEAIEEFLPDEYTKCDVADRYTYTKGSTAGGLVIYDGKFAYSNHATDPCSGLLCNAFDLVRIHRYGDLDTDSLDLDVSKRPSYKAMTEFVSKDTRAKKEALFNTAEEDFADDLEDEEDADAWMDKLDCNPNTLIPLSTINNVEIILKHDPRIKKCFGYNEHSHRIEVNGRLPWRDTKYDTVWTDADDSKLKGWLEKNYHISGKEKIFDGLSNVAQDNHFNPIRDYLDSLEWDGVERLDTLLIKYLCAKDNDYVRAVTRKQFVACVARAYNPGIKKDEMLVLVGEDQGKGKSSILDIMGGAWFSDSVEDFKGKDVAEGLQGRWIIEVSELDAMRRNDVETVKKFLSKRTDLFRMAYGRRTNEYKRACVFFGTTNTVGFLKDSTGERRFWPVDVPGRPEGAKFIFDNLPGERDQMWAEAKYRYEHGEQLWIDGKINEAAVEAQMAHKDSDPRLGQVIEFLEMKLPSSWPTMSLQSRRDYIHNNQFGEPEEDFIIRDKVCASEIWCELFKGTLDDKSKYEIKAITQMMKDAPGWEKDNSVKHYGKIYGTQRGFRRK